jgi:carboxylesterase
VSDAANTTPFYAGKKHEPFTIGEGVAGALLVHGFMGTPAEMRGVGEQLAFHGWTTHAPLLPGFGPDVRSLGEKRVADWQNAIQTEWLALRRFHQPCVLVGYSMGGALALTMAQALQPDAIVLIAPFTRFESQLAHWLMPLVSRVKSALYPFVKADFSDEAVQAQFRDIAPDLDLADPTVQETLRKEVALPTAALEQLRQLGRQAWRAAPNVSCPILILQGRDDKTVLPQFTRALLPRLDGALHYHEVDGGHDIINRVQESDLLRPILDFLPYDGSRQAQNGSTPYLSRTLR